MSGNGPVTFDYTYWSQVYPEFANTVTEPQAQQCFNFATLFLDNSPCSMVPVTNTAGMPVRVMVLGMITAQVAQLLYGSSLQPASPLVGRIDSAAEGSVNVSVALDSPPFVAAWFTQTKYGLMAWAALAPYRTALYIPPPRYPWGQFGPGYFPGGGRWPL